MIGSFNDLFARKCLRNSILLVVLLFASPIACYGKFLGINLPNSALDVFDKASGFGFGMTTSVIGIAWGPWNSPEIQALADKGFKEKQASVDSNRTYALAIHLRKRESGEASISGASEFRIAHVLNVEGEKELSTAINAKGFVGHGTTFAVFDKGQAEYWAMFPVSPDQTEFLFEFMGDSVHAFRIQIKNDRLVFIDLAKSPAGASVPEIEKNFTGKIGDEVEVHFHLKFMGTNISGKETRTGSAEEFQLSGTTNASGAIQLNEENGRKISTGLFKGRSEDGLRTIKGYFSKPDGSGLLPFNATLDSPKKPTSIPERGNQ